VICNRVLEHVYDRRALKEINRILSHDGVAILSVPIIEGWEHTYENINITTPEGRALHFGQHDHLRFYRNDFRQRLRDEFIEMSAQKLGITLRWEGDGINEVCIIDSSSPIFHSELNSDQVIIQIDPRYFRPSEVETLLGDPSKAKNDLGWIPQITLDEMIDEMVAHDLDQAKWHALLKNNGFAVSVSKEG
jgi:SAM-dependent methyltransferase